MQLNVYVKRTAPAGPGRASIMMDPGSFVSPGQWVASEVSHQEGEPIFVARGGKYSIKDRVVTLVDASGNLACELKDFGKESKGVGPGITYDADPDGRAPMNIAWSLAAWPPDWP